jgi:hypothetical protein
LIFYIFIQEPVAEKVEDPEESRSRPVSKKGSRTGENYHL